MQLIHEDFLGEIKGNIIDTICAMIKTLEKDCVTTARYMTKGNACKYADISRPTLQKWIIAGLPIIQIGGVERVDREDIDLFMIKHKI